MNRTPLFSRYRWILLNPIFLFCGILLFYSTSWILSGIVVTTAPPLWSVVVRLSASLLAITAINMIGKGFVPWSSVAPVYKSLILLSFTGFVLFFILTYLSLKFIHPSQLVLALSLIPGITYLIGFLFQGSRHSVLSSLGIIISTASVVWFSFPSLDGLSSHTIVGLAIALFAAINYACYGIIYQRQLGSMPVLGILPYILASSVVIVAALALSIEGFPSGLTLSHVANLALIGAVLAAPIYIFYNLLIVHHGALIASFISVAAPLLTVGLEFVAGLRPLIGLPELVSGVIGSAGVALVIYDRSKRNRE